MKTFVKQNWVNILVGVIVAGCVSYGISGYVPYDKSLALSIPLILMGLYFFDNKTVVTEESSKLLEILDETVKEQATILDEYEQIFDSQLVKLPCVCGGNTFEGLFSPNTENVVECEKCKNMYRVNINYDTVLVSKPLDLNQTFEDLVGKTD